jgi:hypothetical protein
MANNINWGQGANNDIYWGQGATTNTIGWGSVYSVSWAGETELLGDEGKDAIDFRTRVLADEGVFESFGCLINVINF